MKVFNTLSLEKETFEPVTPGVINMYVCGPTVYNYIHIGNARSAIAFDTIRRYLEYRGFDVRYISNFTDVDDKMIKAAAEEGITVPELADRYIAAYFEDTAALNVKPATVQPRATDNIPEIITFVEDLLAKDYAYEVEGDVYFRARKFPDYAHLAHQNLDEMAHNAAGRLDDEEQARKEDPMDFAVWKSAANDNAISWDSPWGAGRPGWHIECSVMATKYLGNNIDIHGGGIDLAFPHHTNEIAQSEARSGETFVHKWLHNGFVTVGDEQEKMSKSLGNFTTVHDLLAELSDPLALRFFMASTQYRRPIAFSTANLEQATNNLNRIRTGYRNLEFRLADAQDGISGETVAAVATIVAAFNEAMDDDFNVQNALAAIYDLVELANTSAQENVVLNNDVQLILDTLAKLMDVFGIDDLAQEALEDDAIQSLIEERDAARAARDFARSDEIREELAAQNILLEDTPQGTRWRRATQD